jgi:hypothetical protein
MATVTVENDVMVFTHNSFSAAFSAARQAEASGKIVKYDGVEYAIYDVHYDLLCIIRHK